MNRGFWTDVLRSGAMLGVVMSLSSIVERYIMAYSDLSLSTMSLLYFVEWIAFIALFIWMLYRSARRRAEGCDPRQGFGYAQALSYVLMVSILTGVVVGVVTTIFISAMGYEAYIDGMVARMGEMTPYMASMDMEKEYVEMLGHTAKELRGAEQPTMLDNVLASVNNYIIGGGFVGLIIAAFVRREPNIFIQED